MNNFSNFDLSNESQKALEGLGFKNPTPIQSKAIPAGLSGQDILANAQTGSGKTLAFALPLIEKIKNNTNSSGLILTPTRELAKQIFSVVNIILSYHEKIRSILLIGGEGIYTQSNSLKKSPQIIIGTPGRINDHLDRGSLNINNCDLVVLDETDKMLEMGFEFQVRDILKTIKNKKQMLMFSATLPNQIIKLSSKYSNNPQRISIQQNEVLNFNIKQDVIKVSPKDKFKELSNQIKKRDGSILVFVKTKYGTEKLSKRLKKDGIKSTALHGGLRQNKRSRIMDNFRDEKFRIMIATDIASRGIDVPHIEHVINYDLPQAPEDFVHRIGRTARAGSVGEALSFITPNDSKIWKSIEMTLQRLSNKGGDKKVFKKRKRR
ncbi:MAG: DEAD/DEAH box helicase [Dehalococcoidia bacterium]|nr:DEAD/DEAH box helicase [Rickettsiales bacterium]MBN32293.1 DEAD/DEAH box helicase [Dehalococcoidia bacterium]|tara:strand:+ start:4670 stop:5803 length:1134 start_codon:yes stop_codon:yes gene_type:complete